MKKQRIIFLVVASMFFSACDSFNVNIPNEITPVLGNFIDDRDGAQYETVTLGTQTWMSQNLNYKTGYQLHRADDLAGIKYGEFYTWDDANIACPTGWHLPTGNDWKTLIEYLGVQTTCGELMKSVSGWANGGNGTNESGFNALPAGYILAPEFDEND